MSNNGSLGGIVVDADFAAFDAMPAEIRRAFADAPYDMAFGDVAEQVRDFQETNGRAMDVREIGFAVEAIREEHGFELEVTAYALYGADHPQARVVSNECLLDLKLFPVFVEMKRWRSGQWQALDGKPRLQFKRRDVATPAIDFVPLHAPRRRKPGPKPGSARRKLTVRPSIKNSGTATSEARVAPTIWRNNNRDGVFLRLLANEANGSQEPEDRRRP
jgi:hypothetical protein